MTASNLVVPLVVWGARAPTHCIASVLMTPDMRRIVTACNDGQIVVWDVDVNAQVRPRHMLLGHTAAVTCLAMGHLEKHYLVSSADNGELSLWDLSDGRCLEHKKSEHTHTHMTAYPLMQARGELRLVCHGYYADIDVLDPLTLEPLFCLAARIQPDWISALCVLRPVKKEDDVVLAITNSGTVKVWTIPAQEMKASASPLYEDESKQIRCLNAQTLRCCAYNQRTVLIVCSKYWQIYDAGDFSLLCSESARCGERWAGGEFISVDRVCVWSNEGKGYLYKLPTNANPESEHYRKSSRPGHHQVTPQAYTVLDCYTEKVLECCPAMLYFLGRRGGENKLLLRGDCEGRIVVWSIPEVKEANMRLVRQESFDRLPAVQPRCVTSLSEQWAAVNPKPHGLIDQLNLLSGRHLEITASIYIPSVGRLVCGRDDGSIVIVPAVQAIVLQLLQSAKGKETKLAHRVLHGHRGRVNCLLYPAAEDSRYDSKHLLSGGVDFTVLLWDVSTGTRLHTYCVHGGEITQLLVPPADCNPRVLPCVASVASDHSLALLSLKERKCILLAARQLFPILTVKWRPQDDFLVIGCTDGTVYVWQMETGHLDRVVHGVTGEEILSACDEKGGGASSTSSDLTNPSISLTQAFRRHNIATFKNFAQQTLQKAHEVGQVLNAEESGGNPVHHPSLVHRSHSAPMLIQGLRTNLKDPDSHVVYFDTEALIVSLLSEEYAAMSPATLEALGFFVAQANDANLSDTQKKMVDLLSKAKDRAEHLGKELQAKAESAGLAPVSPNTQRRKKPPRPSRPPKLNLAEPPSAPSLVLEIAQVLMSCLHAWGLDNNLDSVCRSKLGLQPPKQPISFGLLSRHNHCSLLLPGWHRSVPSGEGKMSSGQWQISSPVTTHHLLSIISIANTLMSMTHATFTHTQRSESGQEVDTASQQAQTKQGWSLLATLHCVLLPECIGHRHYQPPLLDMLARRWQDRCLEIRDAAQALLLAELRRIGASGRKAVVDEWAPYLPGYVDPNLSILTDNPHAPDANNDDNDDVMLGESSKGSESFECRRKQATAIVMMGVLGAEFGAELEPGKGGGTRAGAGRENVVEGFSLREHSHAMHTSKALTYLLLAPATPRLPAHSPIRRAAVDLLGRGFTVWQPYLDVSAVLMGLLDLCVDGDRLVPSTGVTFRYLAQRHIYPRMTFGLPLCPPADACRTARHALSLIATARPPAFVITLSKEVARHNALAASTQGQQQALQNSPLVRARPEVVRLVELLVEKIPNEVADLLPDVTDILVHCLDSLDIKQRGMHEVCPNLFRFTMVSYCHTTRRICTGAKHGGLAFYDLKSNKCQMLAAHGGATSAVAFSPDGKYLASYSIHDSKLLFWQTASSSVFGFGSTPTKCIKTFATPPFQLQASMNPMKLSKLVWVDARTVVLLTADGTETRYRV